jgi:large subunit ribosomal protein L23
VAGKKKRVGRIMGEKPSWKKAVVTLAPGSRIEIYEGV